MSENVREDVQEQVLGAVRKGQEVTLATVKKLVDALSAATAKLPADRLESKVRELPLARKLPTMPEAGAVVSSAYDFAGRLLAEQRTFAEELVKTAARLRPRAHGNTETPEGPAA